MMWKKKKKDAYNVLILVIYSLFCMLIERNQGMVEESFPIATRKNICILSCKLLELFCSDWSFIRSPSSTAVISLYRKLNDYY